MSANFKYFDLTTTQGWEKALKNLTDHPNDSVWIARVGLEFESFPQEVDSKLGVLRELVQKSMNQAGDAVFRKPEHKQSDELAAVGALLSLRYGNNSELIQWGYQTAQRAHRYIPSGESKRQRHYGTQVARAISEKDNPQLFKSWLTYCGIDMLEPYIDACLMGSKKIMEEFAHKQAKRYANRALDIAIWEANSDMFEFLLPHSKPKKGNSRMLARSVKRAGMFRREIEALQRSTARSEDYIEQQQAKYDFIVGAIEKLIPLSDPVLVVRLNTSTTADLEDMELFVLPYLKERDLNELAKHKSLARLYPTIKSWRTRKELMKIVGTPGQTKAKRPGM